MLWLLLFVVQALGASPRAADDAYVVDQGRPLVVEADAGLLANDRDVDNVTVMTTVRHGTLDVHPDGSFRYRHDPQYSGIDSFVYAASNTKGVDQASVTIEIRPLNALSLVPALLTLLLAFATRQVIPSLFAGIVSGALVLAYSTGNPADLNFLEKFFLPAIGSSAYAKILLIYLWSLGALIGIWEKTGGARHFAQIVGNTVVRGPRSSLFFAWLIGLVFHQGGTVSTVLAGTTVKPVTDNHRVSHEEISYIVDSTASPAATLLPFNAWPAYVAALVVGTVPILATEEQAIQFFYSSIPFNFYAIFAIGITLLFSLGVMPWVGRQMRKAITRSRETGMLDREGSRPLIAEAEIKHAAGYTPHLVDFFLPITTLLGLAIVPYVLGQFGVIPADQSNWINEAFVACGLVAMLTALVRGMALHDVMDGFIGGCKSMTIGAIVLGLAVTIAGVARDLHTADYLVMVMGNNLNPTLFPALLTGLCMFIAFACGTSWGTYAVVFPVAMPLAWALNPDPFYLQICFGAVLGGAVFGDQCSPISDTTILAAMFTGCDLMDHVTSQLPLALLAAGLAALTSTALVLAS